MSPGALIVSLAVHAAQAMAMALFIAWLLRRVQAGSADWRARLAGAAFWGAVLLPLASRLNGSFSVSVGANREPLVSLAALFQLPERLAPWVETTAAVGLVALGISAGWRIAASLRAAAAGEGLATRAQLINAAEHGLPPATRLAVSEAVDGPLVAGLWRATIFIPPRVLALPATDRGAILRHELAHIARGDLRRAFVQRLAADLFWWNPGLVRLGRLLEEQRELACDERAALGDRLGYGLSLVAEARQRAAPPMAHAVGAAHGGQLERRIERLADALARIPAGRVAAVLLAMAVLVVLTPRVSDTGHTHVAAMSSR